MSKSTKGLRKAGIASVAVALTLGAGALGAGAANATEPVDFERYEGSDRFATAIEVAENYGDFDEVIIANGRTSFADALAANYLSGDIEAPILLTRQDFMPKVVKDYLASADSVTKVTIVGGVAAVNQAQQDELEGDFEVERIWGADRYETNAKIIAAGGPAAGDLGIVATGLKWADALASGPAAYQGAPIGLSKFDDMPDETIAALKDAGVDDIVIVGGPSAVSDDVQDELDAAFDEVTRVAGAAGTGRSETSTAFAEYAIENLGFSEAEVNVASGYNDGDGADALAGGPLTGKQDRPLLITRNVDNVDHLVSWISERALEIDNGGIFGGDAAVSDAAEVELEEAAQAEVTTNQAYTVSPDGAIEKPASTDTTTNEGAVTFSFGDVDKAVKVALLPASNVSEDANGVVSFEDSDGDANEADDLDSTETGEAQIEQVNGAAYVAGTAVNPVNGTVSVVVDSEGFDEAIVVIYNDADGDGELDLDANNQPAEDFAVGGPVTWLPGEAPNGYDFADYVVWVDKDTNRFVLDDGNLYRYDTNDQYSYYSTDEGDTFFVTPARFETYLSVGDYIETTDVTGYSRDTDVSNEFEMSDDIPGTPMNVTAAVGDFDEDNTTTAADDVRVSWNAPNPLDGFIDHYNLYEVQADGTILAPVDNTDDADTMSLVDLTQAPGDYYYAVSATTVAGDEGDLSAPVKVTVTAPAAPATHDGPPVSNAAVYQDQNSNGIVDGGDILRVTFDETMSAPAALALIELTDADGTVGNVRNGLNSTWSLSDGNTYVITLNAAPVITTGGTVAGVQYGATVTDADGVEDTAGSNTPSGSLEWDLTAGDVTF